VHTGYLLLKDDQNSAYKIKNQVSSKSVLYYPRGEIMDRNGIVLSGRIKDGDISLKDYTAIVGEDVIGKLNYDENNTTSTGVKGVSGLQSLFDSQLNGGNPIKVAMYSDAKGDNINNESALVYGDHLNEGTSLVTTLDYNVQKMVEGYVKSIVAQKKYKGVAAVVTDVKTGDVLAMVSEGEQTNKALICYQPGSVFKILIYAKALEAKVVDLDTKFQCNGTTEIDGVTKGCSKTEGHGEITLKDAFAQSCNIAAYETALLLNQKDSNGSIVYNDVLDLAKEFGFQDEGQKMVKEFPLSYENSSPIIPTKVFNHMDTFNLALGQGKVMASPLTVNKIISAIANDGVYIEPRIVLNEIHPLGEETKYETYQKQVFSKEVNDKLKIMLEEVCKTGTGKENSLAEFGGIAGKSGTAQHITGKENHGWFTGYFPANAPKYAMTVLVQEGGTSSQTALPIFNDLAKGILENNLASN